MRDQDDAFVRRVSDALRGPVEVSPGFDERVMAELRASVERAPRRNRLAWLTRPRTVRLSPLAGLALAAGLVGVAVVGARRVAPPGQPVARAAVPAAPTGAARLAVRARLQPTRFALAAPGARTVAVVGQFNDWDPSRTPLVRGAGGIWEAAVPLGAGRYEYAFLVDGARVVADPAAEETAASDFGAPNSVVTVGGGVP